MQQYIQRHWQLLVMIALVIVVTILVQHAPGKYFTHRGDPLSGVALLRDNAEFDHYLILLDRTATQGAVLAGYPVLGTLYILLPSLIATNAISYQAILIWCNAVLWIVFLFLLKGLLQDKKKDTRLLWLFFLPAFIYFTLSRFDILMEVLVLASILCLFKKKFVLAFLLLAISFYVKWFTLLFLPFFLVYLYRSIATTEDRVKVKSAVCIYIITHVVITVGGILALGHEYFVPYLTQGSRLAGIGSFQYFLQNVLTFYHLDALNYFAIALLFLAQFIVPIIFLINWKKMSRFPLSKRSLILWCALAVVVFIFFSRFYSPQWLIWFIPLFALVIDSSYDLLLIIAYDLLSYLGYPILWNLSEGKDTPLLYIASGALILLLTIFAYRLVTKLQLEMKMNQPQPI